MRPEVQGVDLGDYIKKVLDDMKIPAKTGWSLAQMSVNNTAI